MESNDIIKTLEGAILNAKGYNSKVWSIEVYKLEHVLDLITRQKCEIVKCKCVIQLLKKDVANAKSEAYKEFAERLKNEIINDTAYACDSTQHSGYYDYQIKIGDIPEYIDNLAKEMVGENNG